MKKLFIMIIIALAGPSAGLRAEATPKLPVMEVSFDAPITRGMDYANGTMRLTDESGSVVVLPAKFKTRGATAQSYLMKPSLNMKLRTEDYAEEADSALLGMRSCSSWILDAMAIDRICMRNRVAFDIWNEFSRLPYPTDFDGRNGTEGRFIEMYINGRYYGIYCLSDRINRKLLNLKKVKAQDDGTMLMRGVLYKSGTQDIANQNEPGYNADSTACVIEWHNAWELVYPEDYGGRTVWQPLQEAFAQGHTAAYVKKYFYLENLADYQLHVMALAVADNWGNKNHFLSIRNINKDIDAPEAADADRRRFVITPWDLDTSLGGAYDGSYFGGNYMEWPVSDIAKNSPYTIAPVSGDAEYLSILRRRWIEGRRGAFAVENVRRRMEAYRDLFVGSGAWQRMVAHFEAEAARPKYVVDLTAEIEQIMTWYEARFREMDAYFGITDGIAATTQRQPSTGTAVYDLQGRRVASPASKRGMYILVSPSQTRKIARH